MQLTKVSAIHGASRTRNSGLWKLYLVVYVIGKSAVSASVATLYLYTTELHHTQVELIQLTFFRNQSIWI